MKKDSIINDYYMKCISQKDNINNRISEIHSGKHNDVLDKIREKIYEKYENFVESLKMIEKLQFEINGTPDETLVWKKYMHSLTKENRKFKNFFSFDSKRHRKSYQHTQTKK
jgi:hypothetical protein